MTSKTEFLFSVQLPDFLEAHYRQSDRRAVILHSAVSQESIVFNLYQLQLQVILWRSLMRKFAGSATIPQEVETHAIAVAMEHQEPLVSWICGDRDAIECEVWEVPLLEWRSAVHCLIQGFYAATQRSDWRESKVKNIWKTVVDLTAYCLKGFPEQDITWQGEEGKAGESIPMYDEIPF